MSKFLYSIVSFGVAALAVATIAACQSGSDEATEERLAAVDQALGDLRTQIEANQAEILKRLKGLKAGQMTMVRRGVVISPAAMEKPVLPGDQTGVKIGASPSLGDAEAEIEVVEFADFQCPFCIRNAGFPESLTETYPGKVRVGFRHFPWGRHSMAVPAAKAAWAAQQQGKFWEMHDALFSAKGKLDDAAIRGAAESIGLDMEQFQRDVASNEAQRAVFGDRGTGKKAGVRGTPAYYVNGVFVGNSPNGVTKAIEKALAAGSRPAAGGNS